MVGMWSQKPSDTYPLSFQKDAFLKETVSHSSANKKSMIVFLLEGVSPRCDALKSLQPGLALKPGSWGKMCICKPRGAARNLDTSPRG